MYNHFVLEVDIGGSHISATLVDLESKCPVKNTEIRELVNAKGTSAEIISPGNLPVIHPNNVIDG